MKKLTRSPAKCRQCGEPLTFRPWFMDQRGVRHYAATYGRKVFAWCSVCQH